MNNTSQIKREFIHAVQITSRLNKSEDCLFVNELLHHPDGRTKRVFRTIKNYQRSFYTTKSEFRDHTQKKEFEHLAKLDIHYTNQANLARDAYQAIYNKKLFGYVSMNEVADSPFLYGSDITPPVLLANEYREKWPSLISPRRIAIMDYEWDVSKGTGELLAGVISCKEKVHIAVTKEFLGEYAHNAKDTIINALNIHLREYMLSRKIVPQISIVDSPAKIVIALMNSSHKWNIDYLCFWNMSGDIKKMIEALRNEDYDLADVFSDPSVPDEYKYFNFKEDQMIKKKSSGETSKKHIADLWHTVTSPSKFQCVCMMALFKTVRAREQQRTSYSLDSILHDYLSLGKLKFDFLPENITQLEWHINMQQYHKIEYMVYLAFDGISCELLDEKTGDVSNTLSGIKGVSELSKLKSNPKRLCDDMYFTLLEDKKVLCSTNGNMTEDLDSLVPSINKWIIALASELEYKIGVNLIKEYPALSTNITTHAFDSDVGSAYPNSTIVGNVSKTTRILELCKVPGLTTDEQRSIGINLTSVKANALSLASMMYGMSSLDTLLDDFKKEKNIT